MARSAVPILIGTMGDSAAPISNPAAASPARARRMFSQRRSRKRWLAGDDPQRGFDAGHACGRCRSSKNVGPRREMEQLQLIVVRHTKTADARQRLRERPDDEVHTVEDA